MGVKNASKFSLAFEDVQLGQYNIFYFMFFFRF